MDVLVFAAIVLGIVIVCKIVESRLRKPYVERITDRYVFITGCDSGFGNLLAKQLDAKGVRVIAACLTEGGRSTLQKATSERLSTLILDVTDHDSIVKALERVTEIIPNDSALWGVVNNAGIGRMRGAVEWTRREDYEKTCAVNLFGAVDVTLTFLPLLKSSRGRMVQLTSVGGRATVTGIAGGYHESKFALEAFSDILRRDCIRLGYPVKVSIIEPSFFKTPMTDPSNVTATVMEGWNRLTPKERAQFPPGAAEKRGKMIGDSINMLCWSDTSQVTNALEHALLARWPRTRYTVGIDARWFWLPTSYLPTTLTDPLIAIL